MKNEVVFAGLSGMRISQKLWSAMLSEFLRNGRKTLTDGKVRHLRRKSRR